MVKVLKAFFLLIRWPNLCMIALIPLMVRYGIIKSSLVYLIYDYPLPMVMSTVHFLMLVIGVVCMAAAGYVINDYMDIKSDLINKPHRMIIDHFITKNQALRIYWILNILSLVLSFWVCFQYELTSLFFVFIAASGLLWFYSTIYKHIWLIGNLLVALVVAILPLLPCMMDIILLNKTNATIFLENGKSINYLAYWVLSFSGFAFIYTLIREIIKDTEDMEGDKQVDSQTFPIVFGIQKTKILITILYIIAIICLYVLQYSYLGDLITFWYLTLTVVLSSLISLYYVIKANHSNQFRMASFFTKLASFFGILFAGLFYIILEFLLR